MTTLTEDLRLRDLSPDGKILLADRSRGSASERILGSVTLGQNDWRPFVDIQARVEKGQFSPDGRWVAYESDESGVKEIYIADFPAARHKRRMSSAGGSAPRWHRGGEELFYVAPDGAIMSVKMTDAAQPVVVVKVRTRLGTDAFPYAVARDGRFLIVNSTVDPRSRDLSIVFNWPQLLQEK